ncbi:hypothetical protein [Mycolicibacter senuensis]|uniref:Uncharacterized protein n=1 Tax=Mycolicibacter senuensis TaxID=386913 RepID=A0A7I9XG45_9MYCO|nr:hypothetical protein [Mycolicibacter senuensis]MDQ2626148.1 hypothetical protein [Actinomycetota bacterium]ORW65395.1 hypothetical protein AWC24_17360 [Mycolicibacter senuensis]GFG68941.1 hypothetical protein MSEN_06610 [Mycolicibacter senuensis]
MSQLVVHPGIAMPFDTVARHLRQQGHMLVAASSNALSRIRARLLEHRELFPHLEPAYFENARMMREMYRL